MVRRDEQRPPVRRTAPRVTDLGPVADDEWVVADEEEPTLRRVSGPVPLGSEVERLLRRPGWGERLGAGRVAAHWEEIVGADLAKRCEPVRLAGRVLVVRAESAAWATQLRYLSGQLLERLASVISDATVREIRVIVGRLGESQDDGSAPMRHHGADPRDPRAEAPDPHDPEETR
jgi:predicted nucleic acid-binding Zn ribbon protein